MQLRGSRLNRDVGPDRKVGPGAGVRATPRDSLEIVQVLGSCCGWSRQRMVATVTHAHAERGAIETLRFLGGSDPTPASGKNGMNETRSTHDSFARPDKRRALLAPVVLGAVASAVFAVAACGGSAPGATKAADSSRPEALQHEPCDTSAGKLETLDTNGDGKPDITRVLDKTSGKEICRIGDLNHD